MPIYHRLGQLPRKRHSAMPQAGGGIHYEQLMGTHGFSGPSSLLYHLRPPTEVKSVRLLRHIGYEPDPDPTLRLRHFRTGRLAAGGSPTLDRVPLLYNAQVALLYSAPDQTDEHFFRNALGDEIIVVAQGSGVLETQFGLLAYRPEDQLVLPRGSLYRLRLGSEPHRLLIIESRGWVRTPRRYRGELGQLLEGAPYSERDIRRPADLEPCDQVGEFQVVTRTPHGLSESVLAHHPFDVAGWDGYLYPWALNLRDFEPVVGAVHQPPPVHQVFEGDGFVCCDFCPRPFDFGADAIPAPYFHSNLGTDEVLYYLSREFMSRKGIEFGSITLHPDGMPHGPHPGRYEASIGKQRTEELAFMLDAFQPLTVARQALAVEDAGYQLSWLE